MEAAGPEINVGVMLALSPRAALERYQPFVRRLAEDAGRALGAASGGRWLLHAEEPVRLSSDDPRRPSDFLDEASLRMVEGPFDLVVVVTDVGLVSRRQRVVAGLASSVSRVVVLSTRKLLLAPRGEATRELASEAVRWNAATLLVHLVGHLFGRGHAAAPGEVMAPWRWEPERRVVPSFSPAARRALARAVSGFPEREYTGTGFWGTLGFHLLSALRHPGQVLRPVVRSRAPLLPLSLPTLATAAVAPTFILIFTAEIWDAGLNMAPGVTWSFAVGSILVATWYITVVQNLFFPHEEKRAITEHVAVVNVSVLLTMLLAMAGLFAMVALLMLFVEVYIFPDGLIATWPTLTDPTVGMAERVQIAAFISTIGVLTGALAGGLESRAVIRHLALFRDEP